MYIANKLRGEFILFLGVRVVSGYETQSEGNDAAQGIISEHNVGSPIDRYRYVVHSYEVGRDNNYSIISDKLNNGRHLATSF